MILIGCILGKKAQERAEEVDTLYRIKSAEEGDVTLLTVSDFLEAALIAEEKAAKGEVVLIAGSLSDLLVPESFFGKGGAGFGVLEWRESWLARVEKNHIGFHPLATKETSTLHRETVMASSIIRSYTRASVALDATIKKIQAQKRRGATGYICGRPPYGYRVVAGTLIKDTKQAEAVELIFKLLRKGHNNNSCVKELNRLNVPGYWDRVKIRRILRRASLYCHGICAIGKNKFTIPSLAFLPKDWADTAPSKGTP